MGEMFASEPETLSTMMTVSVCPLYPPALPTAGTLVIPETICGAPVVSEAPSQALNMHPLHFILPTTLQTFYFLTDENPGSKRLLNLAAFSPCVGRHQLSLVSSSLTTRISSSKTLPSKFFFPKDVSQDMVPLQEPSKFYFLK